jgi:PAS domain S-box-containing protein
MKPKKIPAGEAAEISLNRLAAIVESSDDAIVSKDLTGTVTSWNRGAEEIFGYPAAEMIGHSILRIIPPERHAEEDFILGKICNGEKVDHFETLRRRKDGRLIQVSVTASPVKDAKGKIVGVSKITRDISLQKSHEQEITRLSRLYAALSQINQAIVWIRQRDELLQKICRVLVEFGKFNFAWIGMPEPETHRVRPVAHWGDKTKYLSQAVIYADERPEGRGPMGTAIRTGKPFVCNNFTQDTAATPWRELADRAGFRSAAAFPIRQNQVVCGAIMVTSDEPGFFRDMEVALLEEAAGDVTFALDFLARDADRLRAEAALREGEERYRALFDRSLDCVFLLDFAGNFVDANPASLKLLGYPKADLLKLNLGSLMPGDEVARALQIIQEIVITGHQKQPAEFQFRAGDGRQVCVETQSSLIYRDGQPFAIQGIARDLTERRRTEEALAASEKKFRELVQHLDIGLVVHGPDTAIRFANPMASELLGLAPDQMYGKHAHDPVWSFVREDGTAMPLPEYPVNRALANPDGSVTNLVLGICRSDREQPVWVQCNGHAIRNRAGQIQQVEVTFTNLTERKEVEEKLRRANRALQMLSRGNESLVRATSEPELLRAVCRIAVEIGAYRMAWVGYAREDPARSIEPVAQAGDDSGYLSEIKVSWAEKDLNGNGPAGRAIRSGEMVVCKDTQNDFDFIWRERAQQRNFRGVICLPLQEEHRTFGILCLYSGEVIQADAREFKLLQELANNLAFGIAYQRAEQERLATEASHARLATAVEQADESIFMTDAQGTILYVNPAFEKTTGFSRAEALGQNPRIFNSGKHDPAFFHEMWQVLHRGEVWSGHFINRRKDGQLYEEEATISPIRNELGCVVNYVAVKRDVTREVELESQLRQAQKMDAFGQLAGGVAHDFNNILAVIQLQAGLLKTDRNLPLKQLELAADIEKAAERGANLTRQLLLFSRRQSIQPQNLDLKVVLDNITRMLQRSVGEHVQLQLKVAPDPMIIYADPGMMDQILLNLIVNARDAMSNGGQIIIEAAPVEFDELTATQTPRARPGRFACLAVSDDGRGIPPEILPRIFEPFFTTKEVGKGTGLGLATVFGIVQQHKGWINVDSEVGKGTTFRLYLPRQPVASDAVSFWSANSPARGGTETILLVEDEASLRASIRLTLSQLGYHVLEAGTAAEALQIWQSHRAEIRVLLTDLVMPGGMTGRELAQELRRQEPKLKVIYASGYSPEIGSADLKWVEGVNFLAKPFEARKLAHALRANLDQAAETSG